MPFEIPNIDRIVSDFVENGNGISAIRAIEFDRRYLWTIDFLDGPNSIKPPSPFNELFPASDVTLPLANLGTEALVFGQSELNRPSSETARDLNITFYDDNSRTLMRWIYDWMTLDIKNRGAFTSGLRDSHDAVGPDSFSITRRVYPTRQIRLTLLDAYRSEVSAFTYLVFPKDSLDFLGSQASEANTYTVNFSIVDDLSFRPVGSSFGTFDFNTILESLGRFI